MDKSEKRFERDIEAFLISPEGGYTQFNGQDAEGKIGRASCRERVLSCV